MDSVSQPQDSPLVDVVMETPQPQMQESPTETPKEKSRSFRTALLNSSEPTKEDIEKRLALFSDSDDEDEMEQDQIPPTKSRIKVTFSKEHLKRIRQNWKGCLIIKLLGRNIGFKTLMEKIHKIWNLEASITPVDVGLGFYVIRFESKTDYFKVYTGGPWIVQDHYLTIRKWHGNFKADLATAAKTAVWLRFSMLPLEFYDEASIKKIAQELGKSLKVDMNTIDGIRGSYSRVCVEMDLSQPLEPSIAVDRYDIMLEYEHIHQICFSCGRVGHRREFCSNSLTPTVETAAGDQNLPVAKAGSTDAKEVLFNGQIASNGTEEIGWGDWMVVARRKGKGVKTSGAQKPDISQNRQNGTGFKYNLDPNKAGSSRTSNYTQATKKGSFGKAPLPQNQGANVGSCQPKVPNIPSHNQAIEQPKQKMPKPNQVLNKPNPAQKTITKGNPIMAQANNYVYKPIDKDAHTLTIDLNLANSFTPLLPHHHPTPDPQPSSPAPCIPQPSSCSPKKPPDINTLTTSTYHECARTTEAAHQQAKSETFTRSRERSNSPSQRQVVDRRGPTQDQAKQLQSEENGAPSGIIEPKVGFPIDSPTS